MLYIVIELREIDKTDITIIRVVFEKIIMQIPLEHLPGKRQAFVLLACAVIVDEVWFKARPQDVIAEGVAEYPVAHSPAMDMPDLPSLIYFEFGSRQGAVCFCFEFVF